MTELIVDVKRRVEPPNKVYWDIDGSIIAKLGTATITSTIKKRNTDYELTVKIDALTLSDIFGVIKNSVAVPEILKTVGIKDFDLEYKFGAGDAYKLR